MLAEFWIEQVRHCRGSARLSPAVANSILARLGRFIHRLHIAATPLHIAATPLIDRSIAIYDVETKLHIKDQVATRFTRESAPSKAASAIVWTHFLMLAEFWIDQVGYANGSARLSPAVANSLLACLNRFVRRLQIAATPLIDRSIATCDAETSPYLQDLAAILFTRETDCGWRRRRGLHRRTGRVFETPQFRPRKHCSGPTARAVGS